MRLRHHRWSSLFLTSLSSPPARGGLWARGNAGWVGHLPKPRGVRHQIGTILALAVCAWCLAVVRSPRSVSGPPAPPNSCWPTRGPGVVRRPRHAAQEVGIDRLLLPRQPRQPAPLPGRPGCPGRQDGRRWVRHQRAGIFDLDSHAVMSWGQNPVFENHFGSHGAGPGSARGQGRHMRGLWGDGVARQGPQVGQSGSPG